jgi:molecular chaperone GrpE
VSDETRTQHAEVEEETSAPEGAEAAPTEEAHTDEAPAGETETEVAQDLDSQPPSAAGTGELVATARERDEYLALAQRTQADFENYRRRMARENAQAGERGVAKVARELLPALDHLALALKAAEGHSEPTPSAGAGEDVVRGFAMVQEELQAALGRVGIEAFAPEGERFDPNEHEAMAQAPIEGAEPGTVVEVYQQGYRINGTVLRPARVVVAQ